MLELGRNALDADDLDAGVHANIVIPEAERATSELAEKTAVKARRLYQNLSQRWPTLFEFKDDGDSYDWDADPLLGRANRRRTSSVRGA